MTSTAAAAIMKNDNEQPTPTKTLSTVGSSGAIQQQSPRNTALNVPTSGTYVSTGPIEVSKALQDGEKFVKWDEESTSGTPVTMRVDAKGFYLCWVDQNNELDILDIATIRDVRTGPFAKKPRVSEKWTCTRLSVNLIHNYLWTGLEIASNSHVRISRYIRRKNRNGLLRFRFRDGVFH